MCDMIGPLFQPLPFQWGALDRPTPCLIRSAAGHRSGNMELGNVAVGIRSVGGGPLTVGLLNRDGLEQRANLLRRATLTHCRGGACDSDFLE